MLRQMHAILKDRRILLTRTRSQASLLFSELERLGALPFIIPTIEIAPPSTFQALDAVVATEETFDWLLFTSANAATAFARHSPEFASRSVKARIACIGPATAQALRAAWTLPKEQPILIPPISVAESFAEVLLPHVKYLLSTKRSAHMALIRAETARDELPDALIAAGATLTIAPAYRNVLPSTSLPLLRLAFEDPQRAPEAITFTSSSTVSNFVDLLAATNMPLPSDVLRVSIGPITSATLRTFGMSPHAEATEPNIPSLIVALQRAFERRAEESPN